MKLFTAVLLIGIAPALAIAQQRGGTSSGPSQSMSGQPMSSQQSFGEQRSMSFSPQTSPFQSEQQPSNYSEPATQYTPQQSSYQQEQSQPSFNNAPSIQYTPQQPNIQDEQPQQAVSGGLSTPSTPVVSSSPQNEYPTEASRWLPENDFAQPKAKPEPSISQSSPNVAADRSVQVQPEASSQKVQNDLAPTNLNAQHSNSPSTADVLTYHARRDWLKDKSWLRQRKDYLVRPTNFLRFYDDETTGPFDNLTEFCPNQNHICCCDTCDTTCLTHYLKFEE